MPPRKRSVKTPDPKPRPAHPDLAAALQRITDEDSYYLPWHPDLDGSCPTYNEVLTEMLAKKVKA